MRNKNAQRPMTPFQPRIPAPLFLPTGRLYHALSGRLSKSVTSTDTVRRRSKRPGVRTTQGPRQRRGPALLHLHDAVVGRNLKTIADAVVPVGDVHPLHAVVIH